MGNSQRPDAGPPDSSSSSSDSEHSGGSGDKDRRDDEEDKGADLPEQNHRESQHSLVDRRTSIPYLRKIDRNSFELSSIGTAGAGISQAISSMMRYI